MTDHAADLPEALLSAYLDDACTDDERRAVEARLAFDEQWRAVLEETRAARAAVRALPWREPPAGFIESLMVPDADRHRGEEPSTEAAPRRRRMWRAQVVAGVAAAAAVAIGFVVATPAHDHTRVAPPIATLANSHGATVSLQSDPLSGLAPIAATPEPRP